MPHNAGNRQSGSKRSAYEECRFRVTQREITRAVQDEVKSGKDRMQIFEAYRAQFPKPAVLAAVIAGTAREEDRTKYRILNLFLVVLLVLSGVLKVFTIWADVPENPLLATGVSVVGLAISLGFAYAIYTFTGAMYGLIALLAGLSLLNTVLHVQEDPIGTAVSVIFLGSILCLSVVLRRRLFPGLKLFGVKKDGAGQYLLD
jgi:hypothetical protein